jgi:protein-S-isoprenylcysteine O-methyltransferase Ste14
MPLRPRKLLRLRFLPWYLLGGAALAVSPPSGVGLAVGLPAVAAGAGLRGWGAGHLVKTDRLAVSGPYAHLRHPLYAGTLLIAAGLGLAAGRAAWWALPCLALWFFALYFPRKERIESARLERRFGEPYRRYRVEVRALLPRLRRWRPEAGVSASVERGAHWARRRYLDNNEHATAAAVLLGALLLAGRWLWLS